MNPPAEKIVRHLHKSVLPADVRRRDPFSRCLGFSPALRLPRPSAEKPQERENEKTRPVCRVSLHQRIRNIGGAVPLALLLSAVSCISLRGADPDPVPPALASVVPAPNSVVTALTQIEVAFSKSVAGVDAADFLINGAPATNVWEAAPAQFVFEFPQPSAGLVTVRWADNHSITDLADPPNDFAGGSWTYVLDTDPPTAGVVINE